MINKLMREFVVNYDNDEHRIREFCLVFEMEKGSTYN